MVLHSHPAPAASEIYAQMTEIVRQVKGSKHKCHLSGPSFNDGTGVALSQRLRRRCTRLESMFPGIK